MGFIALTQEHCSCGQSEGHFDFLEKLQLVAEKQGDQMKSWMFEKLNSAAAVTMLLTFLASCAPESKDLPTYQNQSTTENSAIVGGVNATLDYQKANGIVGLTILMEDKFGQQGTATCTGTLIARNIVLTAAHCIAEDGIKAIAVIFATDDSKVTKDEVRYAVDGTIHQDFLKGVDQSSNTDTTAWNDLAILKLSADAPVEFKTARLPASINDVNLLPKSKVTLSGFGITNAVVRRVVKDKKGNQRILELPSSGSGVLRKIDGILVKQMSADKKEIILDQSKSKGACHGDSGGPAFVQTADGSTMQVGVTSRGTNKLGNCDESAIYTNVAAHLPWIAETSAKLVAKSTATQVATK